MSAIQQIGILLAVALVWLLINIKAGQTWLKFVSIMGLLAFMVMASWVAVHASGVL
jgi:hypothetical protein